MLLCDLGGPLFPPPPARCLLCVSFLGVVSAFSVLFFLGVPVVALSAALARPACAPCSSPCYPCLAAPHPLTRPSPLPFSVSQPTLPALFVCPLCLCRAVTRACHPCALPLPLPVVPTLFPGVSPTLALLPRSLSLTSSWMPCAQCGRGGVYLRSGLWPCPRTGMTLAVGFLRTMSHRIIRRNTESTTVRRLPNSLRCLCTVESSRRDQLWRFSTELFQSDQSPQLGASPGLVIKGSHFVALLRRCSMEPTATKAWRIPGRPWPNPQSRARVSPMVATQTILPAESFVAM